MHGAAHVLEVRPQNEDDDWVIIRRTLASVWRGTVLLNSEELFGEMEEVD